MSCSVQVHAAVLGAQTALGLRTRGRVQHQAHRRASLGGPRGGRSGTRGRQQQTEQRILLGQGVVCGDGELAITWGGNGGYDAPPVRAHLWIPPDARRLRGLVIGGMTLLEMPLSQDPIVRAAAAEAGLGIVFFIAQIPWITVGHSTGGIFARNVGYWNPQRTAAVVTFKAGRIGEHVVDPTTSIRGVPWLAVLGQYEEFGPGAGAASRRGTRCRRSG